MDPSDTDMPVVGTESHFGDETCTSSGDQLVCSGVDLPVSQPTEENNSFSNATSPKEESNITPSHYCSDEVSLKSEELVGSGYPVLQLENNSFLNATAPPFEEEIETSRTLKEENDVTTSNYRSEEVSLQRLFEKSDAGRRRRTVGPTIQHDEKDGRRIESNGCMSEEEKRHQVNSIISKKDDEWKKDGITNKELDVILNVGSQKFPIKDNLKGFVQMENIKDLEQSEPGMYFIVQGNGAEKHLTALIVIEEKDGTGRRSYVYFDSEGGEIEWSWNHSITYLTEKRLQAAPKTCAFFCLHLLSKVNNGVIIDKNTRIDHLFRSTNFDDEVLETFREVYIRFLQECVNSGPLKTSLTRQMLSIYQCDNS